MKAKDFLMQISKLDKLIENKIIEKEQWKDIATSTTGSTEGDRVQASGSQQKMADAVCKIVEIEAEIDRYIDRLIDKKKDVVAVIEQLPVIEYDVLHKLYIQNKKFQEVADDYNKSYSWVTTIHGRALVHVDTILKERRKV